MDFPEMLEHAPPRTHPTVISVGSNGAQTSICTKLVPSFFECIAQQKRSSQLELAPRAVTPRQGHQQVQNMET